MSRRFHRVSVVLSEGEYQALRGESALQPYGTISEAIREKLDMQPVPYGYLKFAKEQEAADKLGTIPCETHPATSGTPAEPGDHPSAREVAG